MTWNGRWNDHWNKDGKHSFLSPSKYHWINYTPEKLIEAFGRHQSAARGTKLHRLAQIHIEEGIKMPNNRTSLAAFVNDSIGFRMSAEKVLVYSDNCFGTADSISFRDNLLRIFDLKTGVSPGNLSQLVVYSAIFCLEYRVDPNKIEFELKIYHNDIETHWFSKQDPTLKMEVYRVMGVIQSYDEIVENIKSGETGNERRVNHRSGG